MKHLHLFFTLLLNFSFAASAQSVYTLTDVSDFQNVEGLTVLADNNYTFEQILADSAVHFTVQDSVRPAQNAVYWVKSTISNPFAYAENYVAACFPMIDVTLYYYDYNQKKWLNNRTGCGTNVLKLGRSSFPFPIQGQQVNTLYFKVNVAQLSHFPHPFRIGMALRKASFVDGLRQFSLLSTAATILVVLIFFFYNAYIYYIFRDKTYLYYLIIQIGGIGYVLSSNFIFNILTSFRINIFDMQPNGAYMLWDINTLVQRLSTLVISVGFIQLTRAYLDTRTRLPTPDKILKYLLYAFPPIILSLDLTTFLRKIIMDEITALVLNCGTILIMLTIFYTAIMSYRQGYKPARYFLFSNTISLAIIVILAVVYLFIPIEAQGNVIQLANIAVVAQAICLAVALVERFILIRDELKQKQLEAQELAAQNAQIAHNNQLITLENERMSAENLLQKTQNDLLQEKFDSNQRELASTTLYMYQKNEMLADLRIHVETLNKSTPNSSAQTVIKSIENVIQNNLYLDADWDRFRLHFEQVHPHFFDKLQAEHPSLTKNDIRLCAYFQMNLSTKEIAALLNIDPASVRKAKMRLNKKMNIEVNDEI